MLSVPPAVGVKLTVVAKAAPPLSVEEHPPFVLAVAVAVVLAPATNVTDGVGLEEQPPSFKRVVTALRVPEGLTAVPVADEGTVTLPIPTRARVSAPPAVIAVEEAARYRVPVASSDSVFAPCVATA